MKTPTLAEKLGTTTHISALLMKAKRLGLDEEGLRRLAIQRGCDYYHGGDKLPAPSISLDQFTNEELAIALLNPALPYEPQSIRLGAAMLAAHGNDAARLAQLTRMELAETVVQYVARAGERYEPENKFWTDLLTRLRPAREPVSGVLPHPTRFVAMTGITRRGVETITEWIRPAALVNG